MPSLIRGVSRWHQSGDGIEAIEVANHFYLTFWSHGNREVVFYFDCILREECISS
jgi:hypothetical protein